MLGGLSMRGADGPCSLGVTPRSGWAVDPFGYSSTMPYLLKRSNLTGMVIQRVHYAIKKHFAASQNLEFMWRQTWGEGLLGKWPWWGDLQAWWQLGRAADRCHTWLGGGVQGSRGSATQWFCSVERPHSDT